MIRQPRFVVDRCLGKGTPQRLREQGWDLVLIADIFPDDAQHVSDEEWLDWGNENVDGALTKDKSIRRMPWYQRARIPIFSLANQNMSIAEMVGLFSKHKQRIHAIAANCQERQFWHLYSSGEMKQIGM